jgi:hypothetical protein
MTWTYEDWSGINSPVNVHPVLQKHRRQGMFTIQKHLNKASGCFRIICDDDQIHKSQLETSIIKSYTASVRFSSAVIADKRGGVYMAFHRFRIICSVYQQVALQLSETNNLGICKTIFATGFHQLRIICSVYLQKKKSYSATKLTTSGIYKQVSPMKIADR